MRYMYMQNGRKTIVSFEPLKTELMQVKGGCVGFFYDKCKGIHILYTPMGIDTVERRLSYVMSEERKQAEDSFRFYALESYGFTFKSSKDLSREAIADIEKKLEKENMPNG